MNLTPKQVSADLLDQIPDPEIVRQWLAESIRRSALLRSLLRVAQHKANRRTPQDANPNAEGITCKG